jgi:uncharacterized membrane protein
MDDTSSPSSDALAHLEQRVAALEQAFARLAAHTRLPSARPAAPPPSAVATAAREQRAAPAPATQARPSVPAPWRDLGIEEWLGTRGLLAVGVLALLLAAGFFLKYAFDRGWIAPWIRVLGAVLAGTGLALAAERWIARGLHRFGLALVGAGGGLAYLGIWAGAGPYALVTRPVGIVLTALIAAAVAWRAAHHRAELLGLWALAGAFLAPLILGSPATRPEMLLAYLALVGAAAGTLAHRLGWRATYGITFAGCLLLAARFVPGGLSSPAGFAYLAAGGIAAVVLTPSRWPESRLLWAGCVWLLLIGLSRHVPSGEADWARWLAVAALFLATWLRHARLEALRQAKLPTIVTGEGVVFTLSPLAFTAAASSAGGALLAQHPGLAAAIAAALYLGSGWRGRRAPFVALGTSLAALALVLELHGAAVVVGWSALLLLAVVADRWADQRGTRVVPPVLALLAGALVLIGLAIGRTPSLRAFVSSWSLALYAYVAASAAAAYWWRQRDAGSAWTRDARLRLWTLAGIATLVGVTIELHRFFSQRASEAAGAGLAADLSISVWWLVAAGLLVGTGFWRSLPRVRHGGLFVACLAAAKIVIYDLSRLDALYRVASFFVLALLALAVAYAYNRRARGGGAGPDPQAPGG